VPEPEPAGELRVQTPDGVLLSGSVAGAGEPTGAAMGVGTGEGPAVVLLHGLTATRRYVLMGSRALERSGHRVIAYDARAHGRSAPAPNATDYGYELLAADLLAVLDRLGIERAALVGASMGAQTALRVALERPDRVAALALITPAFDPHAPSAPDAYTGWDALARGLREGGVEGFVSAYDLASVPERWRETVATVLRQRLSAHEHPLAVADALEAVPRSRPFEAWADLSRIAVPTLVVASRDQADPGHPLATAERYAREIAGARLAVEGLQESPIAWQGGRLSKLLAGLLAECAGQQRLRRLVHQRSRQ
jgi:pimeloyl-ACP methyl ester carboxylesterase